MSPLGALTQPPVSARAVPDFAFTAVVWIAAALYAVLLSAESIGDHYAYRTGFDTAIYDQLLWLLAHGEDPFSTVVNRPLLADHFQPALVLLTPLYWLGLGVPGLLAAQSVGLALTAPALYALSRALGASSALASLPALGWLLCPWVASVNLFEFRPTAFMPVLLVLSVLGGIARRDILLWATAILALGLKEDVALTYIVLGLLLAYHGRRRLGISLTAVSAIWFVFASWTIKALSGSYDAFGQRFAGDRGESVGEALVWSLEHPLETLSDVTSQSALGLVALVLSTGGIVLLAPSWILLALPSILYNALSAYTPQHDLVHHYHLGTLAGLFVAAAVGVTRLSSLGRRGRIAAACGLGLAAAVALVGGVRVHSQAGEGTSLDPAAAERALDVIPPDAPAAAVLPMLPQLSQRKEIYTLPEPFVSLEWGSPLSDEELAERARRVRFVAYIEGEQARTFYTGEIGTERAVPDARSLLRRMGFVVVARAGSLEILERR